PRIVELDHCGTQPIRSARSVVDRSETGRAPAVTVPADGSSAPASASRTVDLPDPLGPTSAVALPDAGATATPSRAAVRVRVDPSTRRTVRSMVSGVAATSWPLSRSGL